MQKNPKQQKHKIALVLPKEATVVFLVFWQSAVLVLLLYAPWLWLWLVAVTPICLYGTGAKRFIVKNNFSDVHEDAHVKCHVFIANRLSCLLAGH